MSSEIRGVAQVLTDSHIDSDLQARPADQQGDQAAPADGMDPPPAPNALSQAWGSLGTPNTSGLAMEPAMNRRQPPPAVETPPNHRQGAPAGDPVETPPNHRQGSPAGGTPVNQPPNRRQGSPASSGPTGAEAAAQGNKPDGAVSANPGATATTQAQKAQAEAAAQGRSPDGGIASPKGVG